MRFFFAALKAAQAVLCPGRKNSGEGCRAFALLTPHPMAVFLFLQLGDAAYDLDAAVVTHGSDQSAFALLDEAPRVAVGR